MKTVKKISVLLFLAACLVNTSECSDKKNSQNEETKKKQEDPKSDGKQTETKSTQEEIKAIISELEEISKNNNAHLLAKIASKIKRLSSNDKATLLILCLAKLKTSDITTKIISYLITNDAAPSQANDIFKVLKYSLFQLENSKYSTKDEEPIYKLLMQKAIHKDNIADVFKKALQDQTNHMQLLIYCLANSRLATESDVMGKIVAYVTASDSETQLKALSILYDTNPELFDAIISNKNFSLSGDNHLTQLLTTVCVGRPKSPNVPEGTPSLVIASKLARKYELNTQGDSDSIGDIILECNKKNKTETNKEIKEMRSNVLLLLDSIINDLFKK